jgi:hypothetical protein
MVTYWFLDFPSGNASRPFGGLSDEVEARSRDPRELGDSSRQQLPLAPSFESTRKITKFYGVDLGSREHQDRYRF